LSIPILVEAINGCMLSFGVVIVVTVPLHLKLGDH
jgi:hypothetical protein